MFNSLSHVKNRTKPIDLSLWWTMDSHHKFCYHKNIQKESNILSFERVKQNKKTGVFLNYGLVSFLFSSWLFLNLNLSSRFDHRNLLLHIVSSPYQKANNTTQLLIISTGYKNTLTEYWMIPCRCWWRL